MSRQPKPRDVDVLHYRLYWQDNKTDEMVLRPNGGMTIAVRWPTSDNPLTMELAVAHCSIKDPFMRRPGWAKAVGRFNSKNQRIVLNDGRHFDADDFTCEGATFREKCASLNRTLYGAWDAFCYEVSTEEDKALFPERWVTPITESKLNVWLLRASSERVSPDRYPNDYINDIWTEICLSEDR